MDWGFFGSWCSKRRLQLCRVALHTPCPPFARRLSNSIDHLSFNKPPRWYIYWLYCQLLSTCNSWRSLRLFNQLRLFSKVWYRKEVFRDDHEDNICFLMVRIIRANTNMGWIRRWTYDRIIYSACVQQSSFVNLRIPLDRQKHEILF